MFLNDAVVTLEFETLIVVGLKIWVGRLFTKTAKVGRKVSMKDYEWITSFRM